MSAADIFGKLDLADRNFARYSAEMKVRGKLIGGIPKDPDTIKKWLTARMEIDDRAIIELAEQVAGQMQADDGERPSADDLMTEVARQFESGNGFKSVDGELVYEGRCMKAALKEAANVAYPGVDFPGKPKGIKKGLMRYLAERVFVVEDHISLGVIEPSGTEQRIKHLSTPQGPRSAINVVDFVEQPVIRCTIQVLDDFLPREAWFRIWQCAEEIGIGADRARSDGRFDLVGWTRWI